eukprot:CAMPEP_0172758964 /NCGR_PEP_ID=MMETSP1074-20121228/166773_1 /TAXON_ID=2916 /ORGANISM="Ceratium fusus, Strain PA161109" /LENGTH=297 /DNA_ID=CAMNT_0013592651 /DNA_START=10 /DNA_END=900 /DNA_ORIENTATION=+
MAYDMPRLVEVSSWLMIASASCTLVALLLIRAPYGRYTTSKGWGAQLPAKLAWLVMEAPTLWMTALMYIMTGGPLLSHATNSHFAAQDSASHVCNLGEALCGIMGERNGTWAANTRAQASENQGNLVNCVLLIFFISHYIHRAIIFPCLRLPKTAAPMPWTVCFLAFAYCAWNGFNQSAGLMTSYVYSEDYVHNPRFLIGMAIALLGFALNVHADSILMRLKDSSSGKATSGHVQDQRLKDPLVAAETTEQAHSHQAELARRRQRYKIPHGGLFYFVSCANYSAEILEWFGYAVAGW